MRAALLLLVLAAASCGRNQAASPPSQGSAAASDEQARFDAERKPEKLVEAMEIGPGSKVAEIYGGATISERHRHRYEVNIGYRAAIEGAGLKFSGMSPDGVLPELVEREDHPWFVGVQFHPELKSRPFAPHPLFASFIAAAVKQSRMV